MNTKNDIRSLKDRRSSEAHPFASAFSKNILNYRYGILFIALLFGIIAWLIDSLVDYIFFNNEWQTFFELTVTDPPIREVYIRITMIGFFLLFGYIFSVHVKKRTLVESNLRESRENLRITLSSIGDAVISTDIHGNVVHMNPVASRLTKWNEEEASGKPLAEIFHIINAYSREEIENPVKKVFETGKVVGLANHTVLIAKNGKEYQIADSAAPIRDENGSITGIVLVFRDVTEDYEKSRKIEESEAFLKAVFHSIQDGISVLNKDLTIRYVNPVMEKWYQQNLPIIGKKCFECYHNADSPCNSCPTIRCMETGKTESEIISGTPSTGSPVQWLELFSYPLTDIETGEVNGVIEFVRDITQRKQAEKSLKESEERFRLAFDTNPDAIAISRVADGSFVDVNEGFTQITGYSHDEMLSLSSDQIQIWHDSNDRNRLIKTLKDHGQVQNFEARFQIKNGNNIDGIMSAALIQLNGEQVILSISRDITKIKQREKELKEHEQRLDLALKGANLGLWDWNIKTGEVIFNDRWAEMLGYHHDEIEPTVESWKKLVHPDDLPMVTEKLQMHLEGQSDFYHTEHRALTKEGTWKWIYDSGKVLEWDENGKPLRAVGTHLDIDKRKNAEVALRTSEEQYRFVTDHIDEFIYMTDKKGQLTFTGGNIEKLFNITQNDIKTHDLLEFMTELNMDEETTSFIISRFKEAVDNKQPATTYEFSFTIDGNIHHYHVHEKLIYNDENHFISSIGVIREITEQKKYEAKLKAKNEEYLTTNEELSESLDRIQEMNVQIEMAKQQAEESDRLKSAFLANMSHEIRTPMNGILGFAELLKTQHLEKEKQEEYINIIRESGKRMLNLINDLIDISKIEAGQMKIQYTETDVNEILDYCHTFFEPEATAKGIELIGNKGVQMSKLMIETDREKLIAILTNLIKNAIKFTDHGNIRFGYTVQGNFLEFYVKDTGVGIPEERKQAVFERFIHADTSLNKQYEGAGLGLSITKAYIEMLGGSISLESDEGKGSKFQFTLPYKSKSMDKSSNDDKPSKQQPKHNLRDLTVLIAEDDAAGNMYLRETIKKFCKNILTATTGLEALEICNKNKSIDVILMDIKMPGIDGYEATKRIREFDKEVIIIAQTAYALSGDRDKAINAGCNDYLSKPVNKNELVEMLQKYLPGKKQ